MNISRKGSPSCALNTTKSCEQSLIIVELVLQITILIGGVHNQVCQTAAEPACGKSATTAGQLRQQQAISKHQSTLHLAIHKTQTHTHREKARGIRKYRVLR